jgi:hypothetical protein
MSGGCGWALTDEEDESEDDVRDEEGLVSDPTGERRDLYRQLCVCQGALSLDQQTHRRRGLSERATSSE